MFFRQFRNTYPVMNFFADLFGKAKKILKSENPFEILDKSLNKPNNSQDDSFEWDPQEIGDKINWFCMSYEGSRLSQFFL